MKKLWAAKWGKVAIIIVGAIIVASIIGAAAGGGDKKPAAAAATTTPTSTTDTTAASGPEAKPDASYTSNCSYLLGDFTNGPGGFRFVADAQITNTGNIGVIAELRVTWRQAGGTSLKMTRRVKVPVGETRDVGVVRRVTQDQIDQIQSVSGDDCKTVAVVVDTFGEAR